MWWLLRCQGILWRRWVWEQAGRAIVQVADQLGGDVRKQSTGWCIEGKSPSRFRILWTGGIRGTSTVWVQGKTRTVIAPGLASAKVVKHFLETQDAKSTEAP